jgi:hypothetical protein
MKRPSTSSSAPFVACRPLTALPHAENVAFSTPSLRMWPPPILLRSASAVGSTADADSTGERIGWKKGEYAHDGVPGTGTEALR